MIVPTNCGFSVRDNRSNVELAHVEVDKTAALIIDEYLNLGERTAWKAGYDEGYWQGRQEGYAEAKKDYQE